MIVIVVNVFQVPPHSAPLSPNLVHSPPDLVKFPDSLLLRNTTPQICLESQSTAGTRDLRLGRTYVHRRGTDNGRGATVNAVNSTGRTALRADVGDAQLVVCNGMS